MWKLEIIIYTIYFGEYPYNDKDKLEIKEKINNIDLNTIKKLELKDLIKGLLNVDPKKD